MRVRCLGSAHLSQVPRGDLKYCRPPSHADDADNVIVLGFNVRAEGKATELANREGVEIRYYTVIYQAIEEIEAALKGMLKPEFEEAVLGHAEVRQVFRSSRFGSIAGCMVLDGTIHGLSAEGTVDFTVETGTQIFATGALTADGGYVVGNEAGILTRIG